MLGKLKNESGLSHKEAFVVVVLYIQVPKCNILYGRKSAENGNLITRFITVVRALQHQLITLAPTALQNIFTTAQILSRNSPGYVGYGSVWMSAVCIKLRPVHCHNIFLFHLGCTEVDLFYGLTNVLTLT